MHTLLLLTHTPHDTQQVLHTSTEESSVPSQPTDRPTKHNLKSHFPPQRTERERHAEVRGKTRAGGEQWGEEDKNTKTKSIVTVPHSNYLSLRCARRPFRSRHHPRLSTPANSIFKLLPAAPRGGGGHSSANYWMENMYREGVS